MANKVKGEIELATKAEITNHAGGTVIFVLDYNALCSLEDDAPGLMQGEINATSPKLVRRIILEGLRRHQPDVTEQEAGDVIQDMGLQAASEMVNKSLIVTFGADTTSPKGGGAVPSTPGPRKPRSRGPGSAA